MNNLFSKQEYDFDFIGAGFALKKTSDKNIVHLYKNGSFIKEHKLDPAIEMPVILIQRTTRYRSRGLLAFCSFIGQSIDE